jgi:putative transposase
MAFTSVLLREKIAISMDGRGAWRDNVVVERLWRTHPIAAARLSRWGRVQAAISSAACC